MDLKCIILTLQYTFAAKDKGKTGQSPFLYGQVKKGSDPFFSLFGL